MAVAAAAIVVLHLSFVAFVVAGALIVWRWTRVAWLHVPAVAWAVWIELSGGICPLTPLENHLRARAGLPPYAGDFIARWIFPVLYPAGLTREIQVALAVAAIALNVVIYGLMLRRWKRGR